MKNLVVKLFCTVWYQISYWWDLPGVQAWCSPCCRQCTSWGDPGGYWTPGRVGSAPEGAHYSSGSGGGGCGKQLRTCNTDQDETNKLNLKPHFFYLSNVTKIFSGENFQKLPWWVLFKYQDKKCDMMLVNSIAKSLSLDTTTAHTCEHQKVERTLDRKTVHWLIVWSKRNNKVWVSLGSHSHIAIWASCGQDSCRTNSPYWWR